MRFAKFYGLALLGAVVATASAQVQYRTAYNVSIETGSPVTNIMMLEEGDGFGGGTWAFQADGNGSSYLENPFLHDAPVQRSLLIGLTQGLPGDATEDEKHLVLFMDPTAASLSNHIAWGTLFRNTLEEQLIADLELATSGQDWDVIQPGLDGISNFANGDARNGILGPGGFEFSAWFNTGGAFSVMTWSDGQQIGSGTSIQQAVPEPFSCTGLAIGVAALIRRKRAKK